MSHSENNLEKQTKRHSGPLIGIVVVVIFAAVMGLFWAGGDDITDADAQDGVEEIQNTIDTEAAGSN